MYVLSLIMNKESLNDQKNFSLLCIISGSSGSRLRPELSAGDSERKSFRPIHE